MNEGLSDFGNLVGGLTVYPAGYPHYRYKDGCIPPCQERQTQIKRPDLRSSTLDTVPHPATAICRAIKNITLQPTYLGAAKGLGQSSPVGLRKLRKYTSDSYAAT